MNLTDKIKKIGLLQVIDDCSGNMFAYFRYLWCLFTKQVYFGSYLAAKQGTSNRHYYMQKMVEYYCQKINDKIKILEIGSWAGGSAITWAEAVKLYSKHGGMVVCIDQWLSFLESLENKKWVHKTMEKALKKNKIHNLFLHNILCSKHDDIVVTFKGPSQQTLSMLKSNQVDIVFIDGNHSYSAVLNDLENSVPLIKEGGIVCGDDLELQYPYIDQDNIIKMKDVDVAVDPLTKKQFHPGVTLAVWKYFRREVSSYLGFWAMQKKSDNWEEVFLDAKEVCVPKHLK